MKALAAISLALSAQAHLFISTPAPFTGTGQAPLEADGSNFPCQGKTSGPNTDIVAGVPQKLTFDIINEPGTAVHGGGSCQISLSTDMKNWYVIHSYVGGCPANAAGNLAKGVHCTSPDQKECLGVFEYTVPKNIAPNGKLYIAWTWFNNVGNREMYMNCAAVTISGASGSAELLSQLPPLLKANIGAKSGSCITVEGKTVKFPNPGKQVSVVDQAAAVPAGCGSSSADDSTPASPASDSTPANPASDSAAPPKSPATAATEIVNVATPSPAPGAPAVSKSQGGSQGAVACTANGFYCISSTLFGLCANGFAIPMAVARDTVCKNNAITFANQVRRSNFGLY